MAYEIKMLDLIDIELESSFLVLARNMGIRTQVKTWGFLILGPDTEPILVDTGASHPEIMETLGMTGTVTKEMTLRRQLVQARRQDQRCALDPAYAPPHRPRRPGQPVLDAADGRHEPAGTGVLGIRDPWVASTRPSM